MEVKKHFSPFVTTEQELIRNPTGFLINNNKWGEIIAAPKLSRDAILYLSRAHFSQAEKAVLNKGSGTPVIPNTLGNLRRECWCFCYLHDSFTEFVTKQEEGKTATKAKLASPLFLFQTQPHATIHVMYDTC